MEEVLNEIAKAEKTAAEIKQAALDKAAVITLNAQTQAARILSDSERNCAELRQSEIKKAEIDAQDNYVRTLSITRREAQTYADGILKKVDDIVDEIAGRVSRGDS